MWHEVYRGWQRLHKCLYFNQAQKLLWICILKYLESLKNRFLFEVCSKVLPINVDKESLLSRKSDTHNTACRLFERIFVCARYICKRITPIVQPVHLSLWRDSQKYNYESDYISLSMLHLNFISKPTSSLHMKMC